MSETTGMVLVHPRARHGASCPYGGACTRCAFGRLGDAASAAADAFQAFRLALPPRAVFRIRGRRGKVDATVRRRDRMVRLYGWSGGAA